MNVYDDEKIKSEVLSILPELNDEYAERLAMWRENQLYLSNDIENALSQLEFSLGLQNHSKTLPITQFLEDMVVPYIIILVSTPSEHMKLKKLTELIEKLASNPEFYISNTIAASVCEPLLTTYEESFENILPYLGRSTRKLCSIQLGRWKVSDRTRSLLIPKD